jgi:hypothetical protein
LQTLTKRYGGIATIAMGMVADNDEYDISEHELTTLMMAEATRKGVSFEKYFAAPENVEIRKAWALTKSTLVEKDSLMRAVEVQPVSVEPGRTNTASDAQEVYDALMAQAEKLAAAGQYRSVASAFSALFTDTKNAELAARAHRRPNAAHA